MGASITLKEVAKMYDKHMLLANLSFGIKKGSNFIIIGKNGSGKSTILKIIAGIVEIDSGIVYIDGKDINTRPIEVKNNLGYSPQIPSLDSNLTLFENLVFYGHIYGMDKDEVENSVVNWFDFFNISKCMHRYPSKVSFGIHKIVSFIRSIIHKPNILILDEPTMGLEPEQKLKVWEVLDRFFNDKTILFTSQDFVEAEKYADQIALLHNGNINMIGSLDKLIQTTQGITKYSLLLDSLPSEQFIKQIQSMKRIIRPKLSGLELEFYTKEKKDFYNVLRLAIEIGLKDVSVDSSTLRDIFVSYINDENN